MKRKRIIQALFCAFFAITTSHLSAQTSPIIIKADKDMITLLLDPYDIIAKTTSGTVDGILFHVTDTSLVILSPEDYKLMLDKQKYTTKVVLSRELKKVKLTNQRNRKERYRHSYPDVEEYKRSKQELQRRAVVQL